jgi:hypothetical protein
VLPPQGRKCEADVAKKSLFFVGIIGGARTEEGEEAALGEDRREGSLPHPGGEQGIQGRRSRVTRRLPPRRGSFSGVPAAPPHPLRRFLLPARERLLPGDGRSLSRTPTSPRGARGALRLRPCLYYRTRILREKVPQAVDGLDLFGGGEPFGGYSYLGALYVLAPKSSRRWPKSYTPS